LKLQSFKKYLRVLPLGIFFLLFSASRALEVMVYLCATGQVYHCDRSLSPCKHEIFSVTKEEALNKYGRRICGWED
jgi:hypothetical protein